MDTHKILITSSTLFLLPFLYVILFSEKSNHYEKVLSLLFVINFVFSFVFWCNPIKNSLVHKIDAIFVRISVIAVFCYISFIKEIELDYKLIFYIIFLLFIYSALLSNKLSRKNWCSDSHVFIHFFMHLIGITGSYIAFI